MSTKDDKPEREGNSFTDSTELFESIFKEATQEIDTSKADKPKPEKPKFEKAKVERPAPPPAKRKAIPQKKIPEAVKKPLPPSLPISPRAEKAIPPAPLSRGKPAGKEKVGRKSSFLKVILLVVLVVALAGFLVNYFNIFDFSTIPDLLGLGPKPVAQAPPPKKGPTKSEAKGPSAPAQKKAGEKATPAKKEETKLAAAPAPSAPAPSTPPEVKKEEQPAPDQPREEPPKEEIPTSTAQVQPQQEVPVAPAPVQPVQVAPEPVKAETPAAALQPKAPQEVAKKEVPATPTPPPPAPPPTSQAPQKPQEVGQKEPVLSAVKTQPATKPAVKEVAPPAVGSAEYPYSIYLGSYQTFDRVQKALSVHQGEGISAYWTRVNLGDKGTWYRVFGGYFRSEAEAQSFVSKMGLRDAEVKMTKYANLVGVFYTQEEAKGRFSALSNHGFSAYVVPDAQGRFRLYSGAFITKEGAEAAQVEMASKGIGSQVVER